MKYNVKKVQEVPAFTVTVSLAPVKDKKKLKNKRCRSQEIKVCAKYAFSVLHVFC